MFEKSRMFLGCMVLSGAAFCAGEAVAAEMIRPEDESLLEGVFAPREGSNLKSSLAADGRGVSGGATFASGQEDGGGTEMKGARATSRVQAVPLNRASGNATAVAETKASGNATAIAETKASGNATAIAETKASGNVTAVTETKASGNAVATEEIIYVYPNKSEREVARAPLAEWYDATQHQYTGENDREAGAFAGYNPADGGYPFEGSKSDKDRAEVAEYREQIAACFDTRKDGLNLEKSMLYYDNVYDGASYLSETFAEVNSCYENIGYDIINTYYGGNPDMQAAFARKAQSFYVGGTDTSLNPMFCDENCSLRAIADAQVEQFAAFRSYLAQLLVERPQGK